MNEVVKQDDFWLGSLSSNQTKALSLLGQGVAAVMVASTLGVTEGLVSQYLADPKFAAEVVRRKLAGLQKQTDIDNKYMAAEDRLLDKLGKVIPLMTKPMEILKGLQVINGTKRRGMADSPVGSVGSQIVQVNLPTHITAKFITNVQNQIVEIQDDQGSRSLVTATPGAVEKLAKEVSARQSELIEHNNPASPATYREPEIASESGWENATASSILIAAASKRMQESGVSETLPAGLRRSFETKGQITSDDL